MINTQAKANTEEPSSGREPSGVGRNLSGSVDRQFSLLMTAIQLAQHSEQRIYTFRIGENEESSLTGIANAAWDAATSIARALRKMKAGDALDARYVELGEMIFSILDADLHERNSYAEDAEATHALWQERGDLTCPMLVMALEFAIQQNWLPVAKEGEIDIQFHI